MTTDTEKKTRLAEALRANLRRRKAQARAHQHEGGRDDPEPEPGTENTPR